LSPRQHQEIAGVFDALRDAGVLPPPPRALLEAPRTDAPQLAHIRRLLQFVLQSNPAIYSTRNEELAFLANTLVAGCSIQARAITPHEASAASVAICNLGLDNWPLPLPDDFLVE